jgi:hypothetical protein
VGYQTAVLKSASRRLYSKSLSSVHRTTANGVPSFGFYAVAYFAWREVKRGCSTQWGMRLF